MWKNCQHSYYNVRIVEIRMDLSTSRVGWGGFSHLSHRFEFHEEKKFTKIFLKGYLIMNKKILKKNYI